MEETKKKELQFLLPAATLTHDPLSAFKPLTKSLDQRNTEPTTLDLTLSMNIVPTTNFPPKNSEAESNLKNMKMFKQHVAEQVRVAALERAYAERIRELTRRELELAEKEFTRARLVWERARDDLEKVERMKMVATRRVSSTCIEITCHACHQHFMP